MRLSPVLLLRLTLLGLVAGLPANAEPTATEHRRLLPFSFNWLTPLSGQLLVKGFGCGVFIERADCRDRTSGHSLFIVRSFTGYRSYSGWTMGPNAWLDGDPSYQIKGLGMAFNDIGPTPLRVGLGLGTRRLTNQRPFVTVDFELSWPPR
ncbi:hypothetical protein [Nevskia ramosa]|uniref:hypothetical protein n=1 Tax=Nevskia ramosa TaxID=64002 RepID=UPI0023535F1F|nr:hypothetical protein [Nevskia ramosa]